MNKLKVRHASIGSFYEHLENPSPELKKLEEKLNPNDNPVLMAVTLK